MERDKRTECDSPNSRKQRKARWPQRNEANRLNRILRTGGNLGIMRGMNRTFADLIYLDPPFNSDRDYAVPIHSEAAETAFKDTWALSDVDEVLHGERATFSSSLSLTGLGATQFM